MNRSPSASTSKPKPKPKATPSSKLIHLASAPSEITPSTVQLILPTPPNLKNDNINNNKSQEDAAAQVTALKTKLRQIVKNLRKSRAAQKESMEQIQSLETKLEEQNVIMKQQVITSKKEIVSFSQELEKTKTENKQLQIELQTEKAANKANEAIKATKTALQEETAPENTTTTISTPQEQGK